MVQRTTENDYRPAPMARERIAQVDAGKAGEMIGRAVEGFGGSLNKVADNLDVIGERYDTAAVKKADAEDAARIAEIRARALNASGFEAQDAVTKARAEIEEVRKGRLAGLKGSRQKAMYTDVFNARSAQLEQQFSDHAIKQVLVAEKGASAARGEQAQNDAADNYDNPEVFATNVDIVRKEVAAVNRGAGPDVLKVETVKALTGVHTKVFNKIIADPEQADIAEKWVNDYASKINPTAESQMRKQLYPILEEQQGEADFGQFVAAQRGDPSALPPDDGQPDADHPTPKVPRAAGAPIKDVFSHVVGGKGGRISSGYGARSAPVKGASTNHGGVDIPAPEGSPIQPPMSGTVVKSWLDAKNGGGWSLMVRHPNGMMTGYAHMRSQSPLAVGAEVESTTTIGSVGRTGRATGANLHFTVRKDGAKVDPEGINWGSATGSVDAKNVKWKEAPLTKYTADKNTLGQQLDAAYTFATAHNFSPKRYEKLVARIKQTAGMNEALFREREDAQWDAALTVANAIETKTGTGITDPAKQIPGFGLLPPERQMQLRNMANANSSSDGEGGTGAKAGGETFLDLSEASYDPAQRSAFLKIDLRAIPDITKGERARLIGKQAAMRAEGQGGNEQASPSAVRTAVNAWLPVDNKDPRNKERRVQLYDTVSEAANRAAKDKGKPLSEQELDALARRQTLTVIRSTPGALWGKSERSMLAFEANATPKKAGEYDALSLPKADRDRIVAAYSRAHGGEMPTSGQIVRIYQRSIGR